jgi:hypothetical protein
MEYLLVTALLSHHGAEIYIWTVKMAAWMGITVILISCYRSIEASTLQPTGLAIHGQSNPIGTVSLNIPLTIITPLTNHLMTGVDRAPLFQWTYSDDGNVRHRVNDVAAIVLLTADAHRLLNGL